MLAQSFTPFPVPQQPRFIGAGTPMRDLVQAHRWEDTPLGPIASWPSSLRTVASIVLHSVHPMFLWWGEDLIQIYNDAYVPCFGVGKHPAALGQGGRRCWPETWAIIGPQIEAVRTGREARWYADNLVPIWRNGRIEDVYWSYTYTPVFDEQDQVGGVLVVCTETTAQVLAERRRHTLDLLARRLLRCHDEAEVRAAIAQSTSDNPRDLLEVTLLSGGEEAARPGADLLVIRGADLQLCAELALAFGLSPRLPLDGAYRQFLEQFTATVCATLSRLQSDHALAQAMAESDRLNTDLHLSSRIKDEFLAMLGHELRNPLAPIVTALKLMKLRKPDSDTAHEQEVIQRQVDHLVRLVDDLLDVSRIASGKVELRKETVPLADVLNKAIEMASPLLEQKQHRLLVDVPTVRWHGDPARLAQVVSNLLSNAARYTPAGGHVTLATRIKGATVQIQVTDDGNGISPQLLPHIFDLFVQGNRQLDRAKGGLGIGLALVRNLVRMHGGEASAYSAGEGRGSTFTITLPESVISEAEPAVAADDKVAAPEQASGTLVLVVDDNQDAADSLGELLGALGYRAVVAYDPAHALALATAGMPELAILDIGLPGMDGFELAGRLRQLPGGAALKLVALSGYGQEHDKTRSREAGFAAHLVKPININDLQLSLS
ncbi:MULTISPECIES: ATP-binding protein [unclassified Duganella]|uniref:hybrid sensor histidine kinase/response regulator n=1 Tax=unclassified Duganella TaxID=2636909 RepID=UPI0008921BAF|nr:MULTISPECIES: ATP-binding protein [unclassified Duganella]SDH18238.1 Signal transduction histidine kinase [Duganella sp. OV458]SDK32651.1 Signal transduction histidine kinase [Duganella sp. OV510]